MQDRALEYDGFGMLSTPSYITRRVGGGSTCFGRNGPRLSNNRSGNYDLYASCFGNYGSSALSSRRTRAWLQSIRLLKRTSTLFIFFYRQDDPQTQSLGEVFNGAAKALAARADSVVVRITDPSEAGIVNKFQVTKAPMPLVLALAPNGAVTSSFPGNFTKEQLLGRVRYSFNGKTSRHITARETGASVPSKWQDSMECGSDERRPGLQGGSTVLRGYRGAHGGPALGGGAASSYQVGNECPR